MIRYWLLLIFIPALAFAGVHKHVKHKHWTDKYDGYFSKYSKHYFGPLKDWRWFKAQAIAESGLDPQAVSRVGAIGIMQIMPTTMAEIHNQSPNILISDDPKWNIAAGIYYDRQLYKRWKKTDVQVKERLDFTFASYNAGFGRVNKAYNKVGTVEGKPETWPEIAPHVPAATRYYVNRINELMDIKN